MPSNWRQRPLPPCYEPRPGTVNRNGTTIRIGLWGWVSHSLTSSVLAIALRDLLGYNVELWEQVSREVYVMQSPFLRNIYDVDAEVWYLNANSETYRTYITTQRLLDDMGNLGYDARSALWVSRELRAQNSFSTYYSFWKDEERIATANVVRFGDLDLRQRVGDEFPVCDERFWCNSTGLFAGYWVPPKCMPHPERCALMLHQNPATDSGYLEQLVANHNLSIIVAYLGASQHHALVQEWTAENRNFLFYDWTPDPTVSLSQGERISFPDYLLGCSDRNTLHPSGPVECDLQNDPIMKVAQPWIFTQAPEAYYSIANFVISKSQIEGMMANTTEGGGTLTSDDAACTFMKGHPDAVAAWAPDCITRPPQSPQTGDLIFDLATRTCRRVAFYTETPSTSACLSAANSTPQIASRRKSERINTVVRIARGRWGSHMLSASILDIVLKEVMGFSVTLVSGIDPANWGINIQDRAIDIDLENWNAEPDSDAYKQFVTTDGLVATPTRAGYAGRTSIWVLPYTMQKIKFADFWQTYREDQAAPSNFYRFSEVNLSQIARDFPACNRLTHPWCGSGSQEGWFIPPICQNNPDSCMVVFAVAPIEHNLFETVVVNLGLRLVFAYMGRTGVMRNYVTGVLQAGTKDLLFMSNKPDPYAVSVRAVRVSFPDPTDGCASDTLNPLNGSARCDYEAIYSSKLIRSELRRLHPELGYAVDQVLVTSRDMDVLLREWRTRGAGAAVAQTVACEWVQSNFAFLREVAVPDCIANPKNREDQRIGDSVYQPTEGRCVPVQCQFNEVLFHISGTTTCSKCPEGQLPDERQFLCTTCPQGSSPQEQNGRLECVCSSGYVHGNQSNCIACPVGRMANAPLGATECLNCTLGHFNGEEAKTGCESCAVGRFTNKEAATECTSCPQGTFQNDTGSTTCAMCGKDLTTRVLGATLGQDCVCQQRYFQEVRGGPCLGCPEGMRCQAGSDMSLYSEWVASGRPPRSSLGTDYVFPELLAGHMALASFPLDVYSCASLARCPGGPPGTCGGTLLPEVISCSRCREDEFWSSGARRCVSCEGTYANWWPSVVLILPVAIIGLYVTSRDDSDKWGKWQKSVSATCLLLLNHAQMAKVITNAKMEYSSGLRAWVNQLTVVEDPSNTFEVQCTSLADFRIMVTARCCVPTVLFVFTVLTFFGSHFVARAVPRLHGGFDKDLTHNVYFSLIFTFFVSLCSMALTNFSCATNPNGKATLIADRSIHCYEGDWNTVLVVVILAILQIIFFGAQFFWVIRVAPDRFSRRHFRMRWKFLFVKFRPDVWWWALLYCSRGVAMNVGYTFITTNCLQIYFGMLVLTLYGFGVVMFGPWRHTSAYMTDLVSCMGLVAFSALLNYYIVFSAESENLQRLQVSIDVLIIVVFTVPVIVAVGWCIHGIRQQVSQSVLKRNEKELRHFYGPLKGFGESMSEDQAVRLIHMLDDWGRWHILSSLRVLGAEVGGMTDCRKSRLIDGRTASVMTPVRPSEVNYSDVDTLASNHSHEQETAVTAVDNPLAVKYLSSAAPGDLAGLGDRGDDGDLLVKRMRVG